MKYTRPAARTEAGFKTFEVGTHAATITSIGKKDSKNGSKMFVLSLEGKEGEKGTYFLVFGNDYTENNLSFLLASIEDAGAEIPDIEFGHNKLTYQFLNGKEVFIRVEMQEYKGSSRPTITEFLTLDEFENSGSAGQDDWAAAEDDWDN
jgi:hypothetical protein